MTVNTDAVLLALQSIVGDAHARADAATLASYAWNFGVGADPGPRFRKQWPIAVALPGSTEEVAAIVKLCLAEGLNYRAHSTGTGAFYVCQSPNSVVIDLCRMNRIVKIDTVNQIAVIEPYVTAGRLQAEAMKVGLNCHIVGAGPGHSPLASATSFGGIGLTGSTTGTNARNLLGFEWVSPDGEIVRVGADGDDWFSEEGPGPGFRGMIRGIMGAQGALGIFTRIGYKLYPWVGKPQLTITGRQPQLGIEIEEHMRFLLPAWDTVEAMRDATFRINRAQVVTAMVRIPPGQIGWILSASNTEYGQMRERGDLPAYTELEPRFVWQIITHGRSAAQASFQERVLRKIVSETGGRFLEVKKADAEVLARNILNSTYVGRVFRGTMCGATTFGVSESFNCLPEAIRAAEGIGGKEMRPGGSLVNDSKDGQWTWATEGRQLWTEAVIAGEPFEGRGAASTLLGFLHSHHLTSRSARIGTNFFMVGPLVELFGPPLQNVNVWMRRIKDSLDPRWAADPSMYLPRKRNIVMKAFPFLQPMLFSTLGRAVLWNQLRLMSRHLLREKSKAGGG